MSHRVLVPLDGSPFAEAALPAALSLAGETHGEVHLLRVLEVPPVFVFPEVYSPDRDEAEVYLDALIERVGGAGVHNVSRTVREGAVVQEIARAAHDWRADVIVMCTHGRGGVSRLWLGSVADRFLRTTTVPVFLVRPPDRAGAAAPFIVGKVVVPVDGSPSAEAALPWAKTLSGAYGVPLLLVQAITYPGAPAIESPERAESVLAAEREGRAYLELLCRKLEEEGFDAAFRQARAPGAAQVALGAADRDPIVMTTRGRSGVARTFLGSVTDKVVRGAVGPVLVIPPAAAERRGAPA
jgi:nucleotide-binding universal stress UspA family protein